MVKICGNASGGASSCGCSAALMSATVRSSNGWEMSTSEMSAPMWPATGRTVMVLVGDSCSAVTVLFLSNLRRREYGFVELGDDRFVELRRNVDVLWQQPVLRPQVGLRLLIRPDLLVDRDIGGGP